MKKIQQERARLQTGNNQTPEQAPASLSDPSLQALVSSVKRKAKGTAAANRTGKKARAEDNVSQTSNSRNQ
jgi:hypothetical protein